MAELHTLREMLMHKFGREFSVAVMENRDGCVPQRVSVSNLAIVRIKTSPKNMLDISTHIS
jgi:hypothetical protein